MISASETAYFISLARIVLNFQSWKDVAFDKVWLAYGSNAGCSYVKKMFNGQ